MYGQALTRRPNKSVSIFLCSVCSTSCHLCLLDDETRYPTDQPDPESSLLCPAPKHALCPPLRVQKRKTTTRNPNQDILVVTAPGSGAELLPFLRTCVSLPAAIAIITVLCTEMSNVFRRPRCSTRASRRSWCFSPRSRPSSSRPETSKGQPPVWRIFGIPLLYDGAPVGLVYVSRFSIHYICVVVRLPIFRF